MKKTGISTSVIRLGLFRIFFIFCSAYFLLMGAGLALIPYKLIEGFAGNNVNPTMIGILRGAGGSIIPYSLLYLILAVKPFGKKWALYVIAFANCLAIIFDIISVVINEYTFQYALIDIPAELISLTGVVLIWNQANN
ncbi:MAG: hypothetical protein JSV24_11095 [Bacteroidales bacterium]|nr:MAG: hypothetical protein JSV24_11095 [Bacteroidales bacterium]